MHAQRFPHRFWWLWNFFSGVVAGFCFVWVFLAFFCLVVLGCGSLVVCFSFFNMLLKVTKIKQAPWDT